MRSFLVAVAVGLFALVALGAGVSGLAASSIDVYDFPNPETEARYRGLIAEFRCPKCLNTNIAGSDAPIAQDLRRTVHRLLVAEGQSDQAIRDYLHERYGDFVLYDPPLSARTAALWFAPFVFFGLGVLLIWRQRRGATLAAPLADDERDRLAALASGESQSS